MRMRFLVLLLAAGVILPRRAPAQSMSEPQAFFYTAVWDSAKGDFTRSTVQRIRMSSTEYEEFKEQFIDKFVKAIQSTFTTPPAPNSNLQTIANFDIADPNLASPGVPRNNYGAFPGQGPVGAGAVTADVEIRLSLDKKTQDAQAPLVLAFDATTTRQSVQAGSDPRALGAWAFYYWQLSLWEWYVTHDTLLLNDPIKLTDVDAFVAKIKKRREPVWTWSEVNSDTGEPKDWREVNREFPALGDPSPEETAAIEGLRAAAPFAGGEVHVAQLPQLADQEWQGLYRVYREAAHAISAEDHDRYFGLINRLRDRQESRERYYAWLQDRRSMVVDFAKDWARKYDGTEFDVDGVMYLVSKEPLPGVDPAHRNIVIDRVVTPYDLLNEDGTLKRPVPAEE